MTSPVKRTASRVCIIVLAVVVPGVAHAYLDPGSGSYILQILIAGLVAVSFAVKAFWTTIKAFFSNLVGKRGAGSSSSRHD